MTETSHTRTAPVTKPSRRHKSFGHAKPPPDSTVLRHTDECLENVRRYGFCEHTRLPVRQPKKSWIRGRKNQSQLSAKCEFVATVGFAILILCYVALFQQIGWVALPYAFGIGIGWLAVFMLGLPRWLTFDITKTLPADARHRLDHG